MPFPANSRYQSVATTKLVLPDGTEVPQLYLTLPDAADEPGKRLVGFDRVDLFGRDVALLAGPAGAAWCTAAERAARSYAGLALKAYCVGGPHLRDADGRFGDAYDLGPAGACLVRPDGIVAWRAKADGPDREATIGRTLDALLARA